MILSYRVQDNICIVKIQGELINEGGRELESYVFDLLTEYSVEALAINFQQTDNVDSSGLGALVNIYKKVQTNQMKLVFCQSTNYIFEILRSARLDKLIPVYATEEEALKFLGS